MRHFVQSFLIATIGFLAAVRLSTSTDDWSLLSSGALSLALGGAAGIAALRSRRVRWATPVGLFCGVAAGVVVDAAVERASRGADHNLLPIEILAFLLLAVPPVGAGLLLGTWWQDRRVRVAK